MERDSNVQPGTVEEATAGSKHDYGTHDYPDPLKHIDRVAWDVVIIGAGPAGLMLAVSAAFLSGPISLRPGGNADVHPIMTHRTRSLALVATRCSSSTSDPNHHRWPR